MHYILQNVTTQFTSLLDEAAVNLKRIKLSTVMYRFGDLVLHLITGFLFVAI